MSIEIDVLNGDASWPRAEPLMDAVWPDHVMEKLAWKDVTWAHADLRVLIDAPEEAAKSGLACHVGIYFRDATWNGRKVHIGGIGGVATREDCRGRGLAGIALFGMDQLLPVLQIFQSVMQLAEQGLSLRNLLSHIGIAPCARFVSGSDGAHL